MHNYNVVTVRNAYSNYLSYPLLLLERVHFCPSYRKQLLWDTIVRFVDVGGIDDHHCLNILVIDESWLFGCCFFFFLFCWCWWNRWLPLCKLSFHNMNEFRLYSVLLTWTLKFAIRQAWPEQSAHNDVHLYSTGRWWKLHVQLRAKFKYMQLIFCF